MPTSPKHHRRRVTPNSLTDINFPQNTHPVTERHSHHPQAQTPQAPRPTSDNGQNAPTPKPRPYPYSRQSVDPNRPTSRTNPLRQHTNDYSAKPERYAECPITPQ